MRPIRRADKTRRGRDQHQARNLLRIAARPVQCQLSAERPAGDHALRGYRYGELINH